MIVIPMAGLSRRFTDAGYKLPKYMLPAHDRPVFDYAAASFSAYREQESFLFIVRDVAGTAEFVRERCAALGILHATVVVLEQTTRGQAETVFLGLQRSGLPLDEAITIFNIDTFRPNFRYPDFGGRPTDGYLEVFRGEGANWSYVRPAAAEGDLVGLTAEKQPISDLCCSGLYQFASARLFNETYDAFERDFSAGSALKELFVAPMYNVLIKAGRNIRYTLIQPDQIIFCGVPAEYEAVLAAPPIDI